MNTFIAKVSHAYRFLKNSDLLTFVQHVIDALTGNAYFTTPTPGLPLVQAAKNDLETKTSSALSGDRTKISDRNLSRLAMLALLNPLSDYVEFTAAGNISKLDSSGFHLQHAKHRAGELPVPEGFKVSQGTNAGEADLACKAVKNAKSYVAQYTTTPAVPNSVWITVVASTTKITIGGFNPGTLYSFRMAAVGAKGFTLSFTDVITSYIA